ncbi:MAG: SDR family oxidoreductase [Actinomycetota bacterium]
MAELTGTNALVTGGGSGIGLACARHLAADGATVTLMGRTMERLEAGAAEVEAAAPGATVRLHAADAADEDAVAAAVAVAAGDDALDVVVLAAGQGAGGSLVDTDRAAWDAVLATNLTGPMLAIKHAAPKMTGGGSIVALSSIAGVLTHRLMTAYCVSKAGLEMLVRNAADELGAVGIRVNAVRPSLVPTELASGLSESPPIVADYLEQMPLGRLGTTDDIASLVRFLCGPGSTWITGQCIAADGGHTLRRGPDLAGAMARAQET